jgi:4Fe-4S ferredoxin
LNPLDDNSWDTDPIPIKVIVLDNIFQNVSEWRSRKEKKDLLPVVWLSMRDMRALKAGEEGILKFSNVNGTILAKGIGSTLVEEGYAHMFNRFWANKLAGYDVENERLANICIIDTVCEVSQARAGDQFETPVPLDGEIKDPKKAGLNPLNIYKLLPKTNCKKCGCTGCYTFVFSLINREKNLRDCPVLPDETYNYLKKFFGEGEQVENTGLIIKEERCHGCGDCVEACKHELRKLKGSVDGNGGPGVSSVIEVVNGTVRLADWSACKRTLDPPVYCKLCEDRCAFHALELVAAREPENRWTEQRGKLLQEVDSEEDLWT